MMAKSLFRAMCWLQKFGWDCYGYIVDGPHHRVKEVMCQSENYVTLLQRLILAGSQSRIELSHYSGLYEHPYCIAQALSF